MTLCALTFGGEKAVVGQDRRLDFDYRAYYIMRLGGAWHIARSVIAQLREGEEKELEREQNILHSRPFFIALL
jgi:hypothetical protein